VSNTVALVIALGPNRVDIPCMVFPTLKEAETFCDNNPLLEKRKELVYENIDSEYMFSSAYEEDEFPRFIKHSIRRIKSYIEGIEIKLKKRELNELEQFNYNMFKNALTRANNFTFKDVQKNKLFNDYYYAGCGGVSVFVIKEVKFGTPFVGFSLD